MEGRLLETILKVEWGSGVLRTRLVTAGSGGPGHRPPGKTTWLRGARCTDPEEMPEMEARPRPKIATVEQIRQLGGALWSFVDSNKPLGHDDFLHGALCRSVLMFSALRDTAW